MAERDPVQSTRKLATERRRLADGDEEGEGKRLEGRESCCIASRCTEILLRRNHLRSHQRRPLSREKVVEEGRKVLEVSLQGEKEKSR